MGVSRSLAVGALVCLLAMLAPAAADQVLVDNVFLNGYDGWTDMLPPGGTHGGALPNWGILMTGDECLSESSDGRVTTGAAKSGLCKSYDMVNTAETPQTSYHVKATLSTWDNDGFGLLFGYVNEDNYFRVAFRHQPNGNLGYAPGTSVQKVVAGAVTQLGVNAGFIPTPDNTPFDVDVAVNGAAWSVGVNGTVLLSGTEDGSKVLETGRLYGVHSWYQRVQDIAPIPAILMIRGTELRSMTITDGSDNLVRTHTFAGASPVAWRALTMARADGTVDTGADGKGNFHLDFRTGTVVDDTNGYEWATAGAANIDFIGPGAVVDKPGSGSWTNYELKVRMSSADDDGIGLLIRAQSDNTFYRLNFSNQSMAATNAWERAPQGLSIQKCLGGVWSEVFRDDQAAPLFVYTRGQPFDVKVTALGNKIAVEVIKDPTGTPTTITYAPVEDGTDPILSGTVGFTNWGCGNADNGTVYAPYGGVAGTALLTYIPEPSSVVLLGLLGLLPLALRRRR